MRADVFGLAATLKPTGAVAAAARAARHRQPRRLVADASVHAHPAARRHRRRPRAARREATDWLARGSQRRARRSRPRPGLTVKAASRLWIVPVRGLLFGLADALNTYGAVAAAWLAPLVTVSHDVWLLTPVHPHPVGAVTAVDPVAVPAAIDWLGGRDGIRARRRRLRHRERPRGDGDRAAARRAVGIRGRVEPDRAIAIAARAARDRQPRRVVADRRPGAPGRRRRRRSSRGRPPPASLDSSATPCSCTTAPPG